VLEALRKGTDAVAVSVKKTKPKTTDKNIGQVIVIRLSQEKLYLYDKMKLKKTYSVATGQPIYPTPTGHFEIITKEVNPTWINPARDTWGKDEPPKNGSGPGNPLGTRAMALSAPGILIHGTPEDWSTGTAASHGCIRMHMWDVEQLFTMVSVGTCGSSPRRRPHNQGKLPSRRYAVRRSPGTISSPGWPPGNRLAEHLDDAARGVRDQDGGAPAAVEHPTMTPRPTGSMDTTAQSRVSPMPDEATAPAGLGAARRPMPLVDRSTGSHLVLPWEDVEEGAAPHFAAEHREPAVRCLDKKRVIIASGSWGGGPAEMCAHRGRGCRRSCWWEARACFAR
jgi:hypothetical protein